MNDCKHRYPDPERLVGDPVDVVTGAVIDVSFEFQLPGPLPLVWRRYYSSAKADRHYALGWGHSHEYDRRLRYDLDGLRYTGPIGKAVRFPPLAEDGAGAAGGGLHLRRVALRRFRVEDDTGLTMEFAFTDPEQPALLQTLRKDDATIEFRYDPAGKLAGIIDSQGRQIDVESDDAGGVTSLVLRGVKDRTLLALRYDGAGNLIEGIDPYGHRFSFQYDDRHRLTARTDRRGYTFFYDYDSDGRCIRSRGEDGLHEVKLRYLTSERATIVTKADGGEWTYLYDDGGTVTRIIDPYGGVRAFTVDEQGRVIAETDPNGDVTSWVYGTYGVRCGKRSSLGWFSDTPEGPGRPDQALHRIPRQPLQWEYGDLVAASDIALPDADDALFQSIPYDMRRTIRTMDAATTGRSHDALGLLVKETHHSGAARRWRYDAGRNTVRYHDRDGGTYSYEYGSWSLCLRETDPLGQAIAYRYTKTGLLASVTDPGGTTSRYEYDHKDRLIRVRRHGVTHVEYRYDQADNLIEKRDADGNTLIRFEIGSHNLNIARRLASGETHRYTYTRRGRYAGIATDQHELGFDYDRYGHRIRDQRDGLGVQHEFAGPDALGGSTVLGRFAIRYRRPDEHTLVITDPGGRQHALRLLGNGLLERRLSNGTTELAQYDPDGRCLNKVVTWSRRPDKLWTRVYTYSGEGDLLRVEDTAGDSVSHEYDTVHRLRRALYPDGSADSFAYDQAGNLLCQPGLDEVTLRPGNRLLSANGDGFEYDDRQRIAQRHGAHGTTRFFYNACDWLVRCETPEGLFTADYDPLGRRIRKTFNGKQTMFYWDTDRLAAEVHADGGVRIYLYTDAFAMTPLMFLDYSGLDADSDSGTPYFVFCNHLGAPIRVEDEQGQAVWQARLEPYGRAHPSHAALDMPLRFPGHYHDAEIDLHYNRFRHYSPELGRYLQPDPLDLKGGINLYAYTTNPLRQVDVRGDAGSGAGSCGGTRTPNPDGEGSTEDGSTPLRSSIKELADQLDADSTRKPTPSRLQDLASSTKRSIDRMVARDDKDGSYSGWCGNSAMLKQKLNDDGMGGAITVSGSVKHTIVAGKTEDGRYYMYDPTREQFTEEGPRRGTFMENGEQRQFSTENPEITKASRGEDPNAAYLREMRENDGLAVFNDRNDFENAMDDYGRKLGSTTIDDTGNKQPHEHQWYDRDGKKQKLDENEIQRGIDEALAKDKAGDFDDAPTGQFRAIDDPGDFDNEPTLVDGKVPGF